MGSDVDDHDDDDNDDAGDGDCETSLDLRRMANTCEDY